MRIVKDHNIYNNNQKLEVNSFDLEFAIEVLLSEGDFKRQEIAAAVARFRALKRKQSHRR